MKVTETITQLEELRKKLNVCVKKFGEHRCKCDGITIALVELQNKIDVSSQIRQFDYSLNEQYLFT